MFFGFKAIRRSRHTQMTTRGGSSPNKKAKKQPAGFCLYPFTQLNISPEGFISKCCSDISFDAPIAQVTSSTLVDAWQNDHYNQIRKHLLNGDRHQLLHCKQCDYYGIDKKLLSPIQKVLYPITL